MIPRNILFTITAIFLFGTIRQQIFANIYTTRIDDITQGFQILKNVAGVNELGCNPDGITGTDLKPWVIGQYNLDTSMCQGVSVPTVCPDASQSLATGQARYCFNPTDKSFEFAVNTDATHDNGCNILSRPDIAANPGGYSLNLMWDGSRARNDLFEPTYPAVTDLAHLIVSGGVRTKDLTSGTCPPGYPPPSYHQDPVGSVMFMVIADTIGLPTHSTIFYQLIAYDNRDSVRNQQTPNNPAQEPIYVNCSLPATGNPNGFIVINDTVRYYGQDFAMPGGATQTYSMDILNRLKYAISKCPNTPPASAFKITGFSVQNELDNTVNMTNVFTNPSLTFQSDRLITPHIPSDVNSDGIVDVFDYNILVTDFGKTGTTGWIPADIIRDGSVNIFDYNELVGNFGLSAQADQPAN